MSDIQIKLKKTHPNAAIPEQATLFAGCWDVRPTEIIQQSEDFVICKLGYELEMHNYELALIPRSSITGTHWILQNSPGQGDPDYRGEYQYRFRALPIGVKEVNNENGKYFKFIYPEFPYKVGERIGQIYLREIIPIEFITVDELSITERGKGGFGHTGKK